MKIQKYTLGIQIFFTKTKMGGYTNCISAIYQNVKLMTHVVPSNDIYWQKSFRKISLWHRQPMKWCSKCPGIYKLRDYLTEVFHDDDGDEVIASYKY